jgi:hypothetical protein
MSREAGEFVSLNVDSLRSPGTWPEVSRCRWRSVTG